MVGDGGLWVGDGDLWDIATPPAPHDPLESVGVPASIVLLL